MGDNNEIQVRILFFAKAKDLSGLKEGVFKVKPKISYDELLEKITKDFSLYPIKANIIVALNEEYISSDCEIYLKEGDEVAVIPPLSGGNYGAFINSNTTIVINNRII